MVINWYLMVRTSQADIEIFKLDEEGNRIPCEDGEYILEDGRTIVISIR